MKIFDLVSKECAKNIQWYRRMVKITEVTAKFHIRGAQTYVVKNCPICGCSEHKLFGCAKHWAHHKKNNDGLCEQKNS